MEGRHHSGIDDCLTISKVVTRLLNDGYRFETPEVIPDNFVPEDSYKDYSKSSYEQQLQLLPQPQPQSNYDMSLPESVVRLRGLPWQAAEEDIAKFFSPLNIVPGGVHLTLNYQGRANGEAFVEFESEEEAQKSLERHKQHLGYRYVEVFKVNRSEMDHALNPRAVIPSLSNVDPNSLDMRYRGVLRLRGLPYSSSAEEVCEFFRGYSIAPDGVHILVGLDGRPNGDAFVEFASEEQAEQALQLKHKDVMRNRYIELFPSTRGDLFNVLAPPFGAGLGLGSGFGLGPYGGGGFGQATTPAMRGGNLNVGMGGGGGVFDGIMGMDGMGGGNGSDVCIRMRGLPFRATPGDIQDFFKGFSIVPGGIHILFNASDRPTGEAYVEFASPNDASLAMARHRQNMGDRYIELYRSSRTEVMLDINSSGAGRGFGGGMGGVDPNMLFLMPPQNQGLNIHQVPNMGFDPRGINMGGLVPSNINMNMNNNPNGWQGHLPGGGMGMGMGMGGMGMGNMGMGMGNIGNMGMGMGGHMDKPSATVRMRGLPFSATIDDIVAFFSGYDIVPHTINMGVTHNGRPSGEAWVQFRSRQEAARAVSEKNRGHMGSRYVELYPA